jgi:hypothetical protein
MAVADVYQIAMSLPARVTCRQSLHLAALFCGPWLPICCSNKCNPAHSAETACLASLADAQHTLLVFVKVNILGRNAPESPAKSSTNFSFPYTRSASLPTTYCNAQRIVPAQLRVGTWPPAVLGCLNTQGDGTPTPTFPVAVRAGTAKYVPPLQTLLVLVHDFPSAIRFRA